MFYWRGLGRWTTRILEVIVWFSTVLDGDVPTCDCQEGCCAASRRGAVDLHCGRFCPSSRSGFVRIEVSISHPQDDVPKLAEGFCQAVPSVEPRHVVPRFAVSPKDTANVFVEANLRRPRQHRHFHAVAGDSCCAHIWLPSMYKFSEQHGHGFARHSGVLDQ